jgi:hypothetical protein
LGKGWWPVYKGASFNLWNPDTGEFYAWSDPAVVVPVLRDKRVRQQRLAASAFSDFDAKWAADESTLPCQHARIAFRNVTNRTNARTLIVALVPPKIVLTNAAPYLLMSQGDERDQAYLLGVLSSIPLDWYARRVVEVNVNFHLFNAFPVPRPQRGDPRRTLIEENSGRLAAADERFEEWANACGVPVGSVTSGEERDNLIAQIDAAVALLYGLTEDDVVHIFETFHPTWDYRDRLQRVLGHFRDLEAS